MIEQLVQVTDKEVQQYLGIPSHTTPLSLAWAVAQRGNPEVSIEASIESVYIPCGHRARVLTTLFRKCRPGKYVVHTCKGLFSHSPIKLRILEWAYSKY